MGKNFASTVVLVCILFATADQMILRMPDSVRNAASFSSQIAATDPLYGNQASSLAAIGIERAWDITRGSSQVIVAVIDDAIDIRHPDLQGNLVTGKDFVDGDNDPSPSNNSGCETEDHGTAMAGIIGAVGGNAIGIAGVNWNVKIMPLRIGCAYNDQREKQAIEFAIANGAHIINSSYGAPVNNRFENDVKNLFAKAPNVLWVVAAGNHHTNNNNAPMYPANVDIPNRITVAASDTENKLTEWSQFGSTSVELAAPGTRINTTKYSPGTNSLGGSYEQISGTSPATAIVSGVAALMRAHDLADGQQNFSAFDIKAALLSSVTPLTQSNAKLVTDGVVHARNAIDALTKLNPVFVIKRVEWNDGAAGNRVIDSNESGEIVVTFENIGTPASNLSLTISNAVPGLTITNGRYQTSSIARDNRIVARFPATANAISGWQQFEILTVFEADGANGHVKQERRNRIETGILANGAWLTDTLQQDPYDEIHLLHTVVPAGYDNVTFEIEYGLTNDRDIGLAAKLDTPPTVYFGRYLGASYTTDTSYKMDARAGLERVMIPFGQTLTAPRTAHVAIFNTPNENIATPFTFNRSYRVRSCWMSSQDQNQAPKITTSSLVEVSPGVRYQLQASVIDPEGEAVKFWWEALSPTMTPLSESKTLTPSFTAPQTGDFTFVIHGSDSSCHYASSQVRVHIKDANDMKSGLAIFPPVYEAYEGSSVNTRIQASNGGSAVRDLRLLSAPQGVEFDPSNQFLRWENAQPVGEQTISFGATSLNGDSLTGSMKVIIKSNSSGSSRGGGCTIGNDDGHDPTFLILILVSLMKILSFARRQQRHFASQVVR